MQRKTRRRTRAEANAERTAYHEAGHAVMAWAHGLNIFDIQMARRPGSAAEIGIGVLPILNQVLRGAITADEFRSKADSHARSQASSYIKFSLGGPVATQMHERGRTPKWWIFGVEGRRDLEQAKITSEALFDSTLMASEFVKDAEQDVRAAFGDARIWAKVERLAGELTDGVTLSGVEVCDIVCASAA